ncbi:MAG: TonB-dependent receptor [Sphingobacteriales bacterium]|nr:TonB-dependent receptor [Sphingobacteriales bacterium]
MKKHFFVLAAVIISTQLKAQDSTAKILEEAVITASKYPQKQSETGKVLTVINRAQLEKSTGRTLIELLNTIAGTVVIGANNVSGTNQTISIRGASAGNVLLLVDGIPANDPSAITNYFDLNFLNIDQVERIEILKGGQSTLYGSDAVAGVVNIILKKGGVNKMTVYGDFTAGSYHTLKESVGFGGRQKQTEYSVNYTHLASDGFSAAYDKNKTGKFDKDGFDQHAVNGRFGFKAGKKIRITFSGAYSNYNADLDASAFTDEKDYTVKNYNKQIGAATVYTFKKGAIHLNYNYNHVVRKYLDDSAYKSSPYVNYSRSSYTGRTHFAELYGNWKMNQWELLLGADYRFNNTDQWYWSTGAFGPYAPPALHAEMKQVSPYASLAYKNEEGFAVELGGRFNHHSEYGGNFTFTLNPFYRIKNKVKVFANIYSAYKTPTLYQLFDPSAGNNLLIPEKSIVGEVGTEMFSFKNFHGRVVSFYRNTKDAIIYTFNPSTFAGKYQNAGKQTNYGAEAELTYTNKKVTVAANYTYTDGKTVSAYDGTGTPVSKDTTYFNLYRIPKHAININVGVQATKNFFYSLQIHSVSKREEFIYGAVPETLKAYMTIDVYGEYKFDKRIKLFLDMKNFTGNEHVDILGYNSRKFNFTTGINFQL